ncbi:MAG: hypothetical protein ABH877_05480, partial [bacterium]
WYLNTGALDTPLVLDKGEAALEPFLSITPDQATAPPAMPINTEGRVISEQLENESLSFDTTAIGQPHWIKISYFPNWHVKGAEGPYLTSPSFMMVIPTESHVTLYYGRTAANTVGQTLEVMAWLLLLGLAVWRAALWRRRRRLAHAVQDSAPIVGANLMTGSDRAAGPSDRSAIDTGGSGGSSVSVSDSDQGAPRA